MGCDIHIILERKYTPAGPWIGVDLFRWRTGPVATSRNYYRFARLAGVRGDGPEPKGIPADASELTLAEANYWADDAHSWTWYSVKDAIEIFKATESDPEFMLKSDNSDPRLSSPSEHYFNVDVYEEGKDSFDNYRLVFWFDN